MNPLFFNGKNVQQSDIQLHHVSRGFFFADGFFETMRCKNRQIQFLDDHIERIHKAFHAFGFTPLLSSEDLTSQIQHYIQTCTENDFLLKWVFWRDSDGVYIPTHDQVNHLLSSRAYHEPNPIKFNVGIYKKFKIQLSPISRFKCLAATPYVFAGKFCQEKSFEDTLLLGKHNKIVECLYSNIYWIKEGKVYTPSINSGCVEGIMRKQIQRYCHVHSISFEEGLYSLEELKNAEVVFCSNVSGISYFAHIEETTYTTSHPLVEKIKSVLN